MWERLAQSETIVRGKWWRSGLLSSFWVVSLVLP